MIRFAGAICLALSLCPLAARPGLAQDTPPGDRCFPWQEFRDGSCVAKPALSAPPPLPAAPAAAPSERMDPAVQPSCPAATHLDATGGNCIADVVPPSPAPPQMLTITTCDGGTIADGKCACPPAFRLMPLASDPARGGTCVRTDAENCLGGEMTVAGQCLCNGQVTMSGQVYDLEFVRGKCVPKRCPREGPCGTSADDGRPPTSPKLSSQEPERHRDCGRGMVATRSGCVPARRRHHTMDPGDYLRMYRAPGFANPLQN